MGNFHARHGLGLMTAARAGGEEELPLYSGVLISGNAKVGENGIATGFDRNENVNGYVYMPFEFSFDLEKDLDITLKFDCSTAYAIPGGVCTGIGTSNAFSPLYLVDNGSKLFGSPFIGDGKSWKINFTIIDCLYANRRIESTNNFARMIYSGSSRTFSLYSFRDVAWEFGSSFQIDFTPPPVVLQLGTNRGTSYPLRNGKIDLNYCMIRQGGVLLWEGVIGAHKNIPSL